MTDYTAIGNAIKTTFLADAWLGNVANVKTIELEKRGYNIQDQKNADFFSQNDLPAIAIVSNGSGKSSEQQTTNEIHSTVKPQIIGIIRSRNRQTALGLLQTMVSNIESVLEKQKKSTQALGIDAFVMNISTTEAEYKDGEYYLMISTTTCDIEVITTF